MQHFLHKLTALLIAVVSFGAIQAAELTVANHTSFRNCDAVSDLPWTEGFESVECSYAERNIPTCWDRTDADRVYVGKDGEYDKRAHSGTKYLRISQTTATTPQTAVLPAFSKAIKELNIAFYYCTSVGASYGNLVVGYITTGGDFVTLATLD